MMRRTPVIEVDEDFEYIGNVTKSDVLPDGRRYIRGVASGVLEDRDGERVSRRAIAKMAAQPTAGGAVKVVAGTHAQNWLTECGDVVKLEHDREHDELLIEAVLPAEGEDPIADKAWKALKSGRYMGWSIGGKLKKAYYELVDTQKGPGGQPKRRKVLDEIHLAHACLTDKPSYRHTFAQAVAKSFDGPVDDAAAFDEDDDQELLDAEAITKAMPDKGEDPETADDSEQAPPAATGGTDPAGDAPSDAERTADLPEAKRHLACPNCGHEFAADLPDESGAPDPQPKDEPDAAKSAPQEAQMDTLKDTLDRIKALADGAVIEKTEPTEPARADDKVVEPTVVKTDDEPSDVEKMVAASHRHNSEAIETLKADVAKGFEGVADAVNKLAGFVQALPQGRKSTAVVIPPHAEVEKTAADSDDDLDARIEKTDDPVEAARLLIRKTRGI